MYIHRCSCIEPPWLHHLTIAKPSLTPLLTLNTSLLIWPILQYVFHSKPACCCGACTPIKIADPAVMCKFELGCLDFFDCKEIKEDNQVCKILGCFRDSQIHDWISSNHNRWLTLIHDGGANIAAYGKISLEQPTTFRNVHVKTPSKNCLVIDIDTLLIPSAAAILHLPPCQALVLTHSKTKAGALTLGQLQAASTSKPGFQAVIPLSLLDFDWCSQVCLFFSDVETMHW